MITNNYLPPHGPKPPRVEISAPGEEEVKKILCRWEPFHPGASATSRLNSFVSAHESCTGGRSGYGTSL